MTALRSLPLAFKALRQLGAAQVSLYGWHRLGLRSGYLRWRTFRELRQTRNVQIKEQRSLLSPIPTLFELPRRDELVKIMGEIGLHRLLDEADEIVTGQVRLFGGNPIPLRLQPAIPLGEWDAYERGGFGNESQPDDNADIKFVWEPARFGWAFILGRAYLLTGDERHAESFWQHWELFQQGNPSFKGPNWASAQEVAFRILAFVFASQVFAVSPQSTPIRLALLAEATAVHAARIPATMGYARAQNNNHLLSEAAGLFTAGLALRDHPKAASWRELGWKWFNRGLQSQISGDGTYVQHSTNYHRLMLQLALWVGWMAHSQGWLFPEASKSRLASATRWLVNLLDRESGQVPNLGPNDSAYILPLSACSAEDFRPVLQAASVEFLGQRLLPAGAWDEMVFWLGEKPVKLGEHDPYGGDQEEVTDGSAPDVLRTPHSWGYLRAARFDSRPGHADQLHLDLWWRGLNVALDAGTYRYNAAPPWDNVLARTAAHNTLMIDHQEQMLHAGRFLWLDWAQAHILGRERGENGDWFRLVAEHDGYRRAGVVHRRAVTAYLDDHWLVVDSLLPDQNHRQPVQGKYLFRLHWLLPDLPWNLHEEQGEARLELTCQSGQILLRVHAEEGEGESGWLGICLIRAGLLVHGTILGVQERDLRLSGWHSLVYGQKAPALSFSIEVLSTLPLRLDSEWKFCDKG